MGAGHTDPPWGAQTRARGAFPPALWADRRGPQGAEPRGSPRGPLSPSLDHPSQTVEGCLGQRAPVAWPRPAQGRSGRDPPCLGLG